MTASRLLPPADALFEIPSIADEERLVRRGTFDEVPAYSLNIPETIPQLGYGSHQFFRYYGKFPSVVGREIVRRFGGDGASVLDCYAGSGTTLVEAQLAACPSRGIDINPLAVLAANVKTAYYDHDALRLSFAEMMRHVPETVTWRPSVGPRYLDKWFSAEAAHDLSRLRDALGTLPSGAERDFLTVAFLAIVRRTSKAFDGEVRPHVNRAKRPRPPLVAFSEKVQDMLAGLTAFDAMRPRDVSAHTSLGDNRTRDAYHALAAGRFDLAVAHPPYLNSFNYLQVFGLEFAWSEGLENVWQEWTLKEIKAREHRAWPATDPRVVARYYEDFYAAIRATRSVMARDGVLAVVVGDATIRQNLEAVHRRFWVALKEMGWEPIEIWFRTTHYGIGKYAYRHRADYHGDAEKRDAILFFRRGSR